MIYEPVRRLILEDAGINPILSYRDWEGKRNGLDSIFPLIHNLEKSDNDFVGIWTGYRERFGVPCIPTDIEYKNPFMFDCLQNYSYKDVSGKCDNGMQVEVLVFESYEHKYFTNSVFPVIVNRNLITVDEYIQTVSPFPVIIPKTTGSPANVKIVFDIENSPYCHQCIYCQSFGCSAFPDGEIPAQVVPKTFVHHAWQAGLLTKLCPYFTGVDYVPHIYREWKLGKVRVQESVLPKKLQEMVGHVQHALCTIQYRWYSTDTWWKRFRFKSIKSGSHPEATPKEPPTLDD